MEEMKRVLGDPCVQPQRPLGIVSALVKPASNCALLLLRGSLGAVVGPSQFGVETKGGFDLLLWVLKLAMESNLTLTPASLDGIDAFGEIERVCIRAALEANLSLHVPIPLFEILYERGNGELWDYDEHGNYVESHYNRCGVRHGCVLGAFLFCFGNEACLLATWRARGR